MLSNSRTSLKNCGYIIGSKCLAARQRVNIPAFTVKAKEVFLEASGENSSSLKKHERDIANRYPLVYLDM